MSPTHRSVTCSAILPIAILPIAILLAPGCRYDRNHAVVESAAATVTRTSDLRWQTLATGVQLAELYGDRTKAEPFGLRLRYPVGYRKEPHSHPNDAFVTVLSGSYFRGYGNTFDESRGIHLVAGTFSVNPAGVAHYEWVEEPAELEVHATGPWGSTYVGPDGRAVSAAHQHQCGDACGGAALPASGAVLAAGTRAPTVLLPGQLTWKRRADGDEVAVLYGDPARPGPFALRIRSVAGSREAPHHHPRTACITVLSGGFRFGTGATSGGEAAAVGRNDVLLVPAGAPHARWNDGPSLVEVRATGPWSTTWLDR